MKQYRKASFTVEAVYIILITIFLIFAIFYLVFFMRDMIQIKLAINACLQEEEMYLKHVLDDKTGEIDYGNVNQRGIFFLLQSLTDREKIIKEAIKEKIGDSLLVVSITELEVKESHFSIEIKVTNQLNIGMRQVKTYFSKTGFEHEQETKIKLHHPAEFVRGYTTILNTIEDTKGYQLLKDIILRLKDIF